MVESTNVLGKARLLGIKSLRPPVISPCRFNGQQYDLIKRLVMRKSTEKGQFVQMDESFDDDDLAEIDRAMDSECPKSAYEEVVTPLVETIEAVVESEYASVGSNGSNFITRPTNIMAAAHSNKASSIESAKQKSTDWRRCIQPKRKYEVEMCYTTGPDDFYVRTSELHEQFDAITAQMNEYYKVDRHRKPASADMVGRSEVCAIQSWKTLDWRRIVCIQVLHDSSIFELIDSGERFELQVEEMWRLKAIPKVGSMSSLLSIPPVCVHCRLVNQQKVPEHMWQYLCENDLKMAFTILVHHVGQVEGQATEVEIMGLG